MSLQFSLDEPFRALIFDCDGTLVDTAHAHLAAYNAALAHTSEQIPWHWYRTRMGVPAHELLQEFSAERQIALAIEDAVAGHATAYQTSFDQMREITAVAEVARAYHSKVPMAVASNGIRVNVLGSLRGAGLLDLFDTVVAVDEVARGKPAPDLYLEAARRLGVAPGDCIVFEDTAEGLEAAHRAGMHTRDVTKVVAPR
jgi:beta-phosphoglucomutase-like phosphatase (HAD superfamily)